MKIMSIKIECILIMCVSIYILISSYKNHIIVDGFLSAGLFPFITGALMLVLSSIMFVKRDNSKNMKIIFRDILNTIIIISITFITFFICFSKINFYILSTIYMSLIFILLHERRFLYIVIIPVITSVSIYLIFSLSLKIL